jgi:AraC family transcriptional activator of pobA
MNKIPVHQLQDPTDAPIDIRHFVPDEISNDGIAELGAHRDDHYIFFLLKAGTATLIIDFQELVIPMRSLYYILPGQVHHRMNNKAADGWFIAVDTGLVPADYRKVFEERLELQLPYLLNESDFQQCLHLVNILEERSAHEEKSGFDRSILQSVLLAFLGFMAIGFQQPIAVDGKINRPAQLSQSFKQLVGTHIKTHKSPSAYAEMLHVSESYLNEVLKKVTGFTVSYWILQEVMMEAKRLLYHTDLTVKEIAFELGYPEYTHFCRLFKQRVGITAIAFRKNCRQ